MNSQWVLGFYSHPAIGVCPQIAAALCYFVLIYISSRNITNVQLYGDKTKYCFVYIQGSLCTHLYSESGNRIRTLDQESGRHTKVWLKEHSLERTESNHVRETGRNWAGSSLLKSHTHTLSSLNERGGGIEISVDVILSGCFLVGVILICMKITPKYAEDLVVLVT